MRAPAGERGPIAAVLAAIALLTPQTMLGQTPPRFRHDPMKTLRIAEVTAEESREFTTRIAAMHEFLGTLPDVRNPRPPECTYIYTNTEARQNRDTGSVAASSVIGFMTSPPNGPCPKVDNTSITLRINDVRRIYQCSLKAGAEEFCTIDAFQPGPGGFLGYKTGRVTFYVWVRSQEPLLVAVNKEAYLRAFEREMTRMLVAKEAEEGWLRGQIDRIRTRLAALSAPERAMPACRPMAEAGKEYLPWDPGLGACAPGATLGKPNPHVYKSTPSPVDVETILVSTVTGRTVGVSVETQAHKERALANFDFAGLARVLTK